MTYGALRWCPRRTLGIVSFLLLVTVIGCSSGVPQTELDRVQSELTTAREKIAALEVQLQRAEAESKAAADRARLTRARVDALNELVLPAIEGQTPSASLLLTWRDKVVAVNDPELTKRFDALTAARDREQGRSASRDLFSYLLRSTAAGIQ